MNQISINGGGKLDLPDQLEEFGPVPVAQTEGKTLLEMPRQGNRTNSKSYAVSDPVERNRNFERLF